ncbi:hypothetical protein [Tropicimonas sp. S265A]|uniref:hypothetical protein n=1 Tax=Tropicimonas sp. S265A TaxID=3415134 RepID=UPI003C79F0CF
MKGWHVRRDEHGVTVSRTPAPRWDVSVVARLPQVRSRTRLAQQVRQDMWRRLQSLRGFAPAVRVTCDAQGCEVRAGGAITAPFPRAATEAALAELLECPAHRARWVAHA